MFRTFTALLGFCFVAVFVARASGDLRSDATALRGRWNFTLQSRLGGADVLYVTVREGDGTTVTLTIGDPAAVRRLINAIAVVEDWDGASVGCIGPWQFVFASKGKPIVELHHLGSALLWVDGPWVGTPPLTKQSALAIDAWTKRYLARPEKRADVERPESPR